MFVAGLALTLVLVIPTAWFPFQLAKVAVLACVVFVSLLLYVLGGGGKDMLRAHGVRLALLFGLLPLSYLLSAHFAHNSASALLGSGIETDTIVFSVLGFLVFFLSFALFRTLRTAKLLLAAVLVALSAAVLFQWVLLLFGSSAVPFQIFADRSNNLIGRWNDLGLLAGLGLLFVLIKAELALSATWVRRGALVALGVALVLLLAVINFSLVWAFILAGCVVLAITKFLTQKAEEPMYAEVGNYAPRAQAIIERVPWWSLGGAAVAVVFLFAGPMVNTQLTSMFSVASLEVRPSYQSTLDVVNAARGGSPLRLFVGTGPSTFSDSWLQFKPAEVNQSAFWNFDFPVGFSTLLTALGTVGFLGVLAWLVPLLLVLAGLVRVVRLRALSREEKVVAATIGLASLFFFASLIFYVPSQNTVLLGLTLCGAAFGFLWRQGRPRPAEEEHEPSRMPSVIVRAAMLLLLAASLWTGLMSVRHLTAEAMVGRGSVALQGGDFDGALSRAVRAGGVEKSNPDPLRLAVTADINKLQQLAATDAKAANAADVQAQFTTLAQQSVANAQNLIAKNPSDYRSAVLLGQLYELFASLKIEGAYAKAREAYLAAQEINPQNPQIPLMLARLAAGQGDAQNIQTHLAQSLKLKPNYTDAILFLVQLNVAQNDLPSAIQAATAATQSAPGVPSIWFELGLLYYSAGDTAKAIPALESAIALVPDYANAKYFLGLSYYAQKRVDDAMREFTDLAKTNPDSAEVQLILGNLRAGKPPFESAQPPADTPPQDRATAPISE